MSNQLNPSLDADKVSDETFTFKNVFFKIISFLPPAKLLKSKWIPLTEVELKTLTW